MNLIYHIPICNILNYIVHLEQENKRLILLVHAIWYRFFFKINGWWTCIIKVFIVGLNSPVVNGWTDAYQLPDTLHKILDKLLAVCKSEYESMLFEAVFAQHF